jgi:hypothetical protein
VDTSITASHIKHISVDSPNVEGTTARDDEKVPKSYDTDLSKTAKISERITI